LIRWHDIGPRLLVLLASILREAREPERGAGVAMKYGASTQTIYGWPTAPR
jgi:hypothetical protein